MPEIKRWYRNHAWRVAGTSVVLCVSAGVSAAQMEVAGALSAPSEMMVKIAEKNALLGACYILGVISLAACWLAYKQTQTIAIMAIEQTKSSEKLDRLVDALNSRPCVANQGPQQSPNRIDLSK